MCDPFSSIENENTESACMTQPSSFRAQCVSSRCLWSKLVRMFSKGLYLRFTFTGLHDIIKLNSFKKYFPEIFFKYVQFDNVSGLLCFRQTFKLSILDFFADLPILYKSHNSP